MLKDLFQREAVDEVCSRIAELQASSQRQWGKMDVGQMMAHCSAARSPGDGWTTIVGNAEAAGSCI